MLHPLGYLAQPPYTVFRLAGAGELVVLAVEDAKARLHAVFADGVEHLQALGKRAAVVLVRVDEQRRGGALVGVFERRMPPRLVLALPGVAAGLVAYTGDDVDEAAAASSASAVAWFAAQRRFSTVPAIRVSEFSAPSRRSQEKSSGER